MKKEYDFSKMKKVGKGPVLDPKATKVQINMRVDGDVLQWAMREGERLGLGYQTFINMKLHEAMNADSNDMHIREIVREELKKKRA
jgi:uncharacterized protein (DUF4415 family)